MNPIDFSKIKTVHFIGVGGIGTSAVARMFLCHERSRGVAPAKVSGSDMAESEVTNALKEAGATIFIGEKTRNVPADCELVIYTIAIPENHPELLEAKRRGISVLSYPETLGIISKEKYTIVITGTHGKTTTTAMVAKILMDAGFDPTVILGSFLLPSADLTQTSRRLSQKNTRTNFVAGTSKYFVVEGCEYRRSFLNLHPKILVITNIDADHLDYYKDLEDIKSAFAELAAKVPKDGYLLVNSRAPNLERVIHFAKARIGDWKNFQVPVKLNIPGKHNIENAKAALAVARVLGISEVCALKALAGFPGTWRRFEYRGKAKNGALVYDDYGHHPTEIAATLQGARELFPAQKIVVVFQPHLYSRTKQHLAGFGTCFARHAYRQAGADAVIVLPIYAAREKDPGDINSLMVVEEIKKNGKPAFFVLTFAEAATLAQKLSGAGDLILTLGAGETNKIADMLVSE